MLNVQGLGKGYFEDDQPIEASCVRAAGELLSNFYVRRAIVERLVTRTGLGTMDAVAASHMIMAKAVHGAKYDDEAEAVIEHLLAQLE